MVQDHGSGWAKNMFALTTIKSGHSGVNVEGIDVENHPFCFCLHVFFSVCFSHISFSPSLFLLHSVVLL